MKVKKELNKANLTDMSDEELENKINVIQKRLNEILVEIKKYKCDSERHDDLSYEWQVLVVDIWGYRAELNYRRNKEND